MSLNKTESYRPMLDSVCRHYQSLFRHGHPEEARLVELHSSGQTDCFLREYFDHEYRKGEGVMARFAKIASGWQGGRTLDFGCGAGGLTYQIAKSSREAVGLDLEEYKLDFARSQRDRMGCSNVQFLSYDGTTLPFADSSIDSVVCVDVIEHLPTPEHFVSEFHRVLKPGGQLLLSFGPPWYHPHGKHMWAKLPGWWTHLLFPRSVVMRVAGFSPESTWEQLGIHRLSVSKFRGIMNRNKFTRLHHEERINRYVRPIKSVPLLRELFISEVVGVYQKPY
ncbi:MAG TPA: methyltransferase domain-containing protein [Planctomycetaceae bacterium]|nr:methyltransferase domain-containing protein [Planctomycetaceae bacterium]